MHAALFPMEYEPVFYSLACAASAAAPADAADLEADEGALPVSPAGMLAVCCVDADDRVVGFAVAQLACADVRDDEARERLDKHGVLGALVAHAGPPPKPPGFLDFIFDWVASAWRESRGAFDLMQSCSMDPDDEQRSRECDRPDCDWGVASSLAGTGPPCPALLYLMTLGVAPEHRRTGVAKRLLGVLESSARRHPRVVLKGAYLHVIAYNAPAFRFYARLGYASSKHLVDFYDMPPPPYPPGLELVPTPPGRAVYDAHVLYKPFA